MADDGRMRVRRREAIVLAGLLAGMASAALLKPAVAPGPVSARSAA
ncbi:MAG: hypothetical protein ABW173_10495 [Sphingomonas sp.]